MIHRRLGGGDAWFTDRAGGVSEAPYASANLAPHVGDEPGAVDENRRRLAARIGLPDAAWVQPHHVHGTTVMVAVDGSRHGESADGVATSMSGVLAVAIGADCAPIAIANDTAVAAVHAGWRGAADGVVAAGVAAVRAAGRGPVRAVVGPCICARHYEFGAAELDELADRVGPHVVARTESDTPAFDLRRTITHALTQCSVTDVEVLDICTFESADHFSYRRDGRTGRHGVIVARA